MPNFNTTIRARNITINYLNGESGSDSLSAGDVVVVNSSDPTKVKLTTTENDQNLIGVIVGSTTGEGEMTFVASQGVATVKVTGTVLINDYLISSTTSGRAKSATTGRVIGKAVTANVSGNGTVDAILLTGAAVGAVTDHATLSNLIINDDHTQYALLAGRSGGQTINGGIDSGDDLILSSTAHATKGSIIFGSTSVYDEVNDKIGIGNTSPSAQVHIGDAVISPDPFLTSTGIAIVPSSGASTFLMSGSQSSIILIDNDSTVDSKIIQIITNIDKTLFRTLNDAGDTITNNNIISIDHTSGNVAINSSTFVGDKQLNIVGDSVNLGIAYGLYSEMSSAATVSSIAVYGETSDGSFLDVGVAGNVSGTSPAAYALKGDSSATGTESYGLAAAATGAATTNYGIYGDASGATTNYAGYFNDGNVYIKNNLGIGTTSPAEMLHLSSNGAIGVRIARSDNSASATYVDQYKSRGTISSPTAILDNDFIGLSRAYGYQNSAFRVAGYLGFRVDGTPSGNNIPTEFIIVTNNGTTTAQTFGITGTGKALIGGTTSSGSAILELSSTTMGFLPPKMTTTQRNAISSPVVGLVVFNTTNDRLEVYADNASSNRWEDMTGNDAT